MENEDVMSEIYFFFSKSNYQLKIFVDLLCCKEIFIWEVSQFQNFKFRFKLKKEEKQTASSISINYIFYGPLMVLHKIN